VKKIKCILCDGKLVKQIAPRVRDSKNHKIITCIKCGHVQLYPIPSKNDDREFYNKDLQLKNTKYSGTINELRIKNMEDTLRQAAFVRKIVPKKGSILEIGSGYGFFLEEMNRRGFKITGIEISQERIKHCKKLTNVKILNVDLNEQLPELPNFDTIVMFHILEHLIEPLNYLKKLNNLLKSKGRIVVEVPNCEDLLLENNSAYAKWYWQRAHIHYFSKTILKQMLVKSGFKKVNIFGVQRYGLENMFNWQINFKPQLQNPSFSTSNEYAWLERIYKEFLQKKLKSDTLIAVATK